jgi:hypothetical protein
LPEPEDVPADGEPPCEGATDRAGGVAEAETFDAAELAGLTGAVAAADSCDCSLTIRGRSRARGADAPGMARARAVTVREAATVTARNVTTLGRIRMRIGPPFVPVAGQATPAPSVSIIDCAGGRHMRTA